MLMEMIGCGDLYVGRTVRRNKGIEWMKGSTMIWDIGYCLDCCL